MVVLWLFLFWCCRFVLSWCMFGVCFVSWASCALGLFVSSRLCLFLLVFGMSCHLNKTVVQKKTYDLMWVLL